MILGILFFIIGLLWGLKNKYIVPFYYVIWLTLLPYFVDVVFPFKEIENLFLFRTFAAYYIFTMLSIQLLNKKNYFSNSNNKEWACTFESFITSSIFYLSIFN